MPKQKEISKNDKKLLEEVKKNTLALEEVKNMYQSFDNADNIISDKASGIFSSSSLILTLFGTLQIALINTGQSLYYKIGLVLIVIMYIVLVILILWVIAPKKFRTAFVADKEGVEKAILSKNSYNEAILQLIINYLARIDTNKLTIDRKAQVLSICNILFGTLMIFIAILSLFSIG